MFEDATEVCHGLSSLVIICPRMKSVFLRKLLPSCMIVPPVPPRYIHIMDLHPQKPLVLSISKDLSYKHNILQGGYHYASYKLYHRYPVGVGIKQVYLGPTLDIIGTKSALCQELLKCGCRVCCSGSGKYLCHVLPYTTCQDASSI